MAKTELVIVPTPGMGHLLSIVEFAKLVVQTNPNISIVVLIYHVALIELKKIESYIESQSRELDSDQIEFITLPPLSNPPDSTDPAFYGNVIQLQHPLVRKAVQDRQSKPAAFVLDLMNASMIDVANEFDQGRPMSFRGPVQYRKMWPQCLENQVNLGPLCTWAPVQGAELLYVWAAPEFDIPSYIYFTSGANFLDAIFHFQEIADEQGIDAVTGLTDDPESVTDLPGFMNPVPNKVLPWLLVEKDSVWPPLFFDIARKYREAKGILVNSFMELESFTFQALQNQDNVPTVYPVGPLLSLKSRDDSKSSNDVEDDIINWLDGQPKSSVVFLCFGSMCCFDAEQVKEIADGLDRSGHRFLWSLRKPVEIGSFGLAPSENMIFDDALPEGFMDRTAHRGKIIPWAPQTAVLAHQAIGGFVSHCGWNSILESIWFGVPLGAWPMYSEQQLNAFTLVKELGLAVEIKLDYRWDFKKGNCLVKAEEVEDGVRKLMSMDDEIRRKVREISELSRKVLQTDNGSSRNSLTRFIAEITEK